MPQQVCKRPQAQGIISIGIQAVQVHGSIHKYGHRCPHQRPVPGIPLHPGRFVSILTNIFVLLLRNPSIHIQTCCMSDDV